MIQFIFHKKLILILINSLKNGWKYSLLNFNDNKLKYHNLLLILISLLLFLLFVESFLYALDYTACISLNVLDFYILFYLTDCIFELTELKRSL